MWFIEYHCRLTVWLIWTPFRKLDIDHLHNVCVDFCSIWMETCGDIDVNWLYFWIYHGWQTFVTIQQICRKKNQSSLISHYQISCINWVTTMIVENSLYTNSATLRKHHHSFSCFSSKWMIISYQSRQQLTPLSLCFFPASPKSYPPDPVAFSSSLLISCIWSCSCQSVSCFLSGFNLLNKYNFTMSTTVKLHKALMLL